MKKLLSRLILWAIGDYKAYSLDLYQGSIDADRAIRKSMAELASSLAGSEKELDNRIVDLSKRLVDQSAALSACAQELQELRAKLAEQPTTPPQTVRRAVNHGEFRIAAEAAARERK